MTFVFLTGLHNSNGSCSFDKKKLNTKKNINLNFIFASTANVKPLTANHGLRSGVNKINVNLKVSIVPYLHICLICRYIECNLERDLNDAKSLKDILTRNRIIKLSPS